MVNAFFRVIGCMFNQGNFVAPEADMSGKHVLVTGPTIGGIGFETALQLAVRRGVFRAVPVFHPVQPCAFSSS